MRENAYKYNFEDNVAYCLELGKSIESNIYTYTTSFDEMNYDKGKLDFIKMVAYYGYDYPGHDTLNYYMATQEIIWNRLTNYKISWVINLNPDNAINVEKEKNNIMKLFNTHYIKPSFDGKEIEYTLGEELVLEDTNNILDRYITETDNVVIEGNKLILTKDFAEEEIIFTKPNYTKNKFLLYTSGISQKMMSVGGIDNVKSTIKVKLMGGSLKVNKIDKDTLTTTPSGEATLKGAVYELYKDGKLIDNIIIGEKEHLTNLQLGKYTLKEKIAPLGYMLDKNTYTIEITKDNLNIALDLKEEVIKRKIEIFKVFASNTTGELTPEPNITFEIYDKNNMLINTLITDTEGHAHITLPYGTYKFKQTTTTENHYKVDDFSIKISEYNEKPIYKLLSNSKITAKVKIITKDVDTKENILNSNIKYKIYDVKNNEYLSLKVPYPEYKITDIFEVNKNGIFITPIPLSPGKYIIEQVKESMNGYLYNDNKITIEVGESSNFINEDGELLLEVPFYNKRVKGIINITKYEEVAVYKDNNYSYEDVLIENSILNLYAKEDIYENGKLIYKKDYLVKELITDNYGKVSIDNLPLGEYYLKDKEEIYDVTLSYKDEVTPIVEENIEIRSKLNKGILTINKYESNTKNPIYNTLIEVCTKNGIVVYKGYSNVDGQIILDDLLYGEYYLSEVEAATGYRLLEDDIYFEINKENQIVDIYNERIEVPKTGLPMYTPNLLAAILIILGIIFIVIFHKDKRIIIPIILTIIISSIYLIFNTYKYYQDYNYNKKSIEDYINKEIKEETTTEAQYNYTSVLEIPSINLKRGILDINNEYNKAKYNIELLQEDKNTLR